MGSKLKKRPTDYPTDVYTLGKPWRDLRPAKALGLRITILGLAATWVGVTQIAAQILAAQGQTWIGRPAVGPFFVPWSLFSWSMTLSQIAQRAPDAVNAVYARLLLDSAILAGSSVALGWLVYKLASVRARGVSDTHGGARFSTHAEKVAGHMYDRDEGSYLGYDAVPKSLALRRDLLRAGHLRDALFGKTVDMWLRGDPEYHEMLVAPPGASKTRSHVFLQLVTWMKSLIFYDLKGEGYLNSAGYREKYLGNRVLVMTLGNVDDPRIVSNAALNPLDMIYRVPDGEETPKNLSREYQDALDVAEMLLNPGADHDLDPSSKAEVFFEEHTKTLALALVLFVIYTQPPELQTVRRMWEILTDPEHDPRGILDWMMQQRHAERPRWNVMGLNGQMTRSYQHPAIVRAAGDIVQLTGDQMLSVVGSLKKNLNAWRSELVAEVTARSTFHPKDLLDAAHPVTLYLVVPPASQDSLRPVIRLILNCLLKGMIAGVPPEGRVAPRCRLLIDEFDALGRVAIIASSMQILRGWGITVSIILQSIAQLNATYRAKAAAIIAFCQTQIFYRPADLDTARDLSAMCGKFTHREAGPARDAEHGPGYVDSSVELFSVDSLLAMPNDRALIFTRSVPRPIYAFRRQADDDPEFAFRISVPSPTGASAPPAGSPPGTDDGGSPPFTPAPPPVPAAHTSGLPRPDPAPSRSSRDAAPVEAPSPPVGVGSARLAHRPLANVVSVTEIDQNDEDKGEAWAQGDTFVSTSDVSNVGGRKKEEAVSIATRAGGGGLRAYTVRPRSNTQVAAGLSSRSRIAERRVDVSGAA